MVNRIRSILGWLATLEIWVVGVLVAASFVSARFLPAALIAAIFFWLIRAGAANRLTLRTPADLAILLLVLMLPVTWWATALPDITRPQVYRLLVGIALYYAILNWATTLSRLRIMGVGAFGAGFVLCLIALISVNWPIDKLSSLLAPIYNHFSVYVSDSVNANVMAGSLVILFPIPMAWVLFGWKQMSRLLRLASTATIASMVVILALTLSRGAWMAFGVALTILLILRWKRSWIALLALGIAGAAATVWGGITPVLSLLLQNNTLGGLDGRAEVWSRALYMIRDFSLTGIGMGNFGPVADAMYPFYLAAPGRIPHAHNLFFQIAVDMGIPGLIAWLGIFIIITFLAFQIYRTGRKTNDSLLLVFGAGLLSSQAALAVHGLTDAVTWGMVRSAPIVWALWGITAAAWSVYTSKNYNLDHPLTS